MLMTPGVKRFTAPENRVAAEAGAASCGAEWSVAKCSWQRLVDCLPSACSRPAV